MIGTKIAKSARALSKSIVIGVSIDVNDPFIIV